MNEEEFRTDVEGGSGSQGAIRQPHYTSPHNARLQTTQDNTTPPLTYLERCPHIPRNCGGFACQKLNRLFVEYLKF